MPTSKGPLVNTCDTVNTGYDTNGNLNPLCSCTGYTPGQCSQMLIAQNKVAAAQSALDAVNQNVTSSYHNLDILFNAGGLAPSCYNGQGSLTAQLGVGTMNHQSCCRGLLPGCGSSGPLKCSSCKSAVDAFNQAYNTYYTAKGALSQAQSVLASEKANLKTVLDTIQQQVANDPNQIANTAAAAAAAAALQKKEQTKWIFFGLITIAVVVAAFFIGKLILGGKQI